MGLNYESGEDTEDDQDIKTDADQDIKTDPDQDIKTDADQDIPFDDDKHPEDCYCLISDTETSDYLATDLTDHISTLSQKNKRKISTSSSSEAVSIKPKFQNSLLSKLAYMLPEWGRLGGKITTDNNRYESLDNYRITDTCTIDYFILAISFSVVLNSRILPLLRSVGFSNQNFITQIDQTIELVR